MNRMRNRFLPAYLVALLILPSYTALSEEQAKQKKAPPQSLFDAFFVSMRIVPQFINAHE